ncbi:DUF6387 family protein [Deefgea piscis]|uniref:DUF6387 family protein n=1 Tax=Deefgea piscis TaxID=2739061 RepID=UPI001C7ED470|nr:DUF6387 family protein [Deefgea piscis]QZA81967.1 hypothetical protein K4H25_04775 [Deefgea piscis]
MSMNDYSWLNNVMYDSITEKFTLHDWSRALAFRAELLSDSSRAEDELIRFGLRHLFERPTHLNTLADLIASGEYIDLTHLKIFDAYCPNPAISNLTTGLALAAARDILERPEMGEVDDAPLSVYDFHAPENFLSMPLHFIDAEAISYIGVNLELPDALLFERFKDWLAATRHELEISKPRRVFTKVDTQKWRDMKILQYLDLSIYLQSTGVELGQQLIGVLLFPNTYDISPSERIRKVVAPLAEKLISYQVLSALRTQNQQICD